jgi:hypothetical protein
MRGFIAGTVLIAAATSLPVAAQETTRRAGGGLVERFNQLDRDGNGKVSAAEMGNPELHEGRRDRHRHA